jgi:putative ABC transport system permease protein
VRPPPATKGQAVNPPRLPHWLLRRLVPPGPEGDTIRGDLLEEFSARAHRSRARATLWYWAAVASMLFRYRRAGAAIDDRSRQPLREALVQDVRYACRTLVKAPTFTAVVLVTLAVGIGANTAIFSALNAVLLKPLPYRDADRLVRLVAHNPTVGIRSSNVSAADFMDWRRDAQSFEALAAFSQFSTSMRGVTADAPAERIGGVAAVDLFPVLGISPAVGRDFRPEEIRPGIAAAAIVSDGFWRRRFGGDASVVGRPLRPGSATSIVGVMPRGFSYPDEVDLWVPGVLDPAGDPRNNRYLEALGRLKAGVTIEQAQAELDGISARLDAAYADTNRGWRVRAVPLTDFIVGDARQTLLLLLGAVGLVMLVACANVANLFLAHASGRQREIAVRSAIGAPRGRIFRQVLTESLLLSLLAGALGILIGKWGLQLLIAIGASGIPRLEQASLDRTVLFFSIGVSVATGVLFGLLPALQLSRSNLVQTLREGTRAAGTRGRTRQVLVVAEVAVALVLLVAAGLLGRSFRGLQQVDVGFQPANLLTMRVTLAGPKYRQPGPGAAYYDEAIKRISALPGVRSVGAVLALPVGGGGFYLGRGFIRPGLSHPQEGYTSGFQAATPGYFRTMGITLLKGRDFDARDTDTSAPVAVINRTLAERFFAGENPIGQKVLVWHDEKTPREIVGVVGDLKSADLTATAGVEMFVPHTQSRSLSNDMTLVVRTEGPPAAATAAVKAALQSIDPVQAAYDARTFDAIMGDALARQRFSVTLFAAFAGLALALAAVGLYGVMTHVVAGRTHEMGVRMALGARPGEVRGLVVREGMGLLGAGLALGIPAALGAAYVLRTLLYGVGPGDPVTLGAVVALIATVTWVSAWLPARRATRVDPAQVLRGD